MADWLKHRKTSPHMANVSATDLAKEPTDSERVESNPRKLPITAIPSPNRPAAMAAMGPERAAFSKAVNGHGESCERGLSPLVPAVREDEMEGNGHRCEILSEDQVNSADGFRKLATGNERNGTLTSSTPNVEAAAGLPSQLERKQVEGVERAWEGVISTTGAASHGEDSWQQLEARMSQNAAKEAELIDWERKMRQEELKVSREKQFADHNLRTLQELWKQLGQHREELELKQASLNYKQLEFAHKEQVIREKAAKIQDARDDFELSCQKLNEEKTELRERNQQHQRREQDCQAKQESLYKEQKKFARAQEELAARERNFETAKKYLQGDNPKLRQEIWRLSHILDRQVTVVVPPSNPPVKAIPPAPPTPPAPTVAPTAVGDEEAKSGMSPQMESSKSTPAQTDFFRNDLSFMPDERESPKPPPKAAPIQPHQSQGRGQILDASWGPPPMP